MKLISKLVVVSACIAALPSVARPAYETALPNVNCGSCHVSAAGGGARNDFGQDVEASMPFAGPNDATWAALFCVDSDGDGKTNGQELGDPCGAWRVGDSDPDFSETNPGDAAATTDVVGECDGAEPQTCDLTPPADAGSCASTSTSPMTGLALLGVALLALRRRRR